MSHLKHSFFKIILGLALLAGCSTNTSEVASSQEMPVIPKEDCHKIAIVNNINVSPQVILDALEKENFEEALIDSLIPDDAEEYYFEILRSSFISTIKKSADFCVIDEINGEYDDTYLESGNADFVLYNFRHSGKRDLTFSLKDLRNDYGKEIRFQCDDLGLACTNSEKALINYIDHYIEQELPIEIENKRLKEEAEKQRLNNMVNRFKKRGENEKAK